MLIRSFNLHFVYCIGILLNFSYLKDSEQCGVPLPGGKIVGGVDSGGYRYPWFALLLFKKNSNNVIPVCGGSLVTKFHVLTAAHCFTIDPTTPNKDLFNVAFGTYDICNDKESTRIIFGVNDVIIHEMYKKRGKFYDIALIKLDRAADFTVICLPFSGVPDATENALLIGFGVLNENSNSVPCHMMEVNVTKYSKMDCSNSHLPLEDKKESSVICAGSLSGSTDSCYGDSGGPLQTLDSEGRYLIAGIVSYGYGCGTPEVPGIYTNVGTYLHWIQEKIFQSETSKANKKLRSNTFNDRRITQKKQSMGVIFPINGNNLNLSQPKFENSKISIHRTGRNHFKITKPVTKNIYDKENQTNTQKSSTVIFRDN